MSMMKQMAKQPLGDIMSKNVFNILSVGRLDPVKRLSVVPQIAAQLKSVDVTSVGVLSVLRERMKSIIKWWPILKNTTYPIM